MAKTLLVVVVLLLAVSGRSSAELSKDEEQKCQSDVGKLMDCLPYTQKSASDPTAKCCKSVSDLRTEEPACLCYFLAGSLKGDAAFKQLNVDSSRMLSLSTACKLQNSSVSDCPALLKLSPGSPDAALFNASATPGATPKITTTTTSSGSSSSDAYMLQLPFSRLGIYVVFIAVFFIIFPTWP